VVNLKTKVWVPAHITGFFTVNISDSKLKTGSTGAGINLEKGLWTEVEVERSDEVYVDSSGTGGVAARKLLDRYDMTCSIETNYKYQLPVGMGFGMSGAEALGTVVALSKALSIPVTLNQAGVIAHESEVELMSGLGDVSAQLHEGVTINSKPGSPEKRDVDRVLTTHESIHLLTLDKIETSSILTDDDVVEKINRSGKKKLRRLKKKPSLNNLLELSREFTFETEVAPNEVKEILSELEAIGVNASMAMIGQTIFSIDGKEFLEDYGEVTTIRIADRGPQITRP